MNPPTLSDRMRGRALASVACVTLALPLALPAAAQTPADLAALGGARSATTLLVLAPHQMTTRKKVVLLVGAAALYYLYRHHQAKARAAAQVGQPIYYLSANGRVYYRDANHQAHWVTPPPQGIQVSSDEAQSYQGLQGYAGAQAGETNLSRFAARPGGM